MYIDEGVYTKKMEIHQKKTQNPWKQNKKRNEKMTCFPENLGLHPGIRFL